MMELAYNDMRPFDAQYSTTWDGLAAGQSSDGQEFAGSSQSISVAEQNLCEIVTYGLYTPDNLVHNVSHNPNVTL